MQVLQLSLIFITLFFVCSVAAVHSGIVLEAALFPRQIESPTSLPPNVARTLKRETNADRLRRGLGPLPPTLNAARSFLKPRASPTPCAPLTSATGTIQLNKVSDGSLVGYVSNIYDSQDSYTITSNVGSALQVSLPFLSPFGTPIDITAINGPDSKNILLGAVGGSPGFDLQSGQLGTAYLSGTGHTGAGSPPSSTAGTSMQAVGYDAPSESQIWTLDCVGLTFTATWTNSDDTQPAATTIFYNPTVKYLGLTGDLDVLNGVFNEGAFAVTFTFVPQELERHR